VLADDFWNSPLLARQQEPRVVVITVRRPVGGRHQAATITTNTSGGSG
jgi:hypothetical protein